MAGEEDLRGRGPPATGGGVFGEGETRAEDGAVGIELSRERWAKLWMASRRSWSMIQAQPAARLKTMPAAIQPREMPAPKRKRKMRERPRIQHSKVMKRARKEE